MLLTTTISEAEQAALLEGMGKSGCANFDLFFRLALRQYLAHLGVEVPAGAFDLEARTSDQRRTRRLALVQLRIKRRA
jgi:hypothetical protein